MVISPIEVSQGWEEKFREYLASRPRPQRYTRPQQEIAGYIFQRHTHFDADQLIDNMKQAGLSASRATVYRTLAKLVDAGLLRRLDVGPRTFYERDYGRPQHEHMRCERCGKIIEFQDPRLEKVLHEVCRSNNFLATGHTFIIQGTCSDCNHARVTRRLLDLV